MNHPSFFGDRPSLGPLTRRVIDMTLFARLHGTTEEFHAVVLFFRPLRRFETVNGKR